MSDTAILIGAAGGAAAIVFFQRRLDSYVLPLRLDMAEAGERLAADVAVSPELRDAIRIELDSAFSRWMMPIATLLIPLTLVLFLAGWKGPARQVPPELRADLARHRLRLVCSWAAANPLFAALAAIEAAALFPIVVAFKLTLGGVIDALMDAADRAGRLSRRLHEV